LFVKIMPPPFIESGRKLMENQWGHWFDEGLQPGFQMKIFRRGEQPLFVWRKPLYLEPSSKKNGQSHTKLGGGERKA